MKPVERPRVTLIGLTLDLYREALPGILERYRIQLDRMRAAFGQHATVTDARLCWNHGHVEGAVASAEKETCDALVVVALSYTASLVSVPALASSKLPLILWNTQEARSFDAAYSYDDLLMNHTVQGIQDVASALVRRARPFAIESGQFEDARPLEALGEWLHAARAARMARGLRVGLLGRPFEGMGDFISDDRLLVERWGPQVVHLGRDCLARALEGLKPSSVAAEMARDRERFEIDPSLTEEAHRTSARLGLALAKVVEEQRLDAFSMNFLEIARGGGLPTLPFLGINKLMAEGLGYAGEGDAATAALMAEARQLCGEANFTEIYTVDFKGNRMLMSHMQECNPALARRDRRVRLLRKGFWAPGVAPYAGMHFTLEPGPVTLACVTLDAGGKFRFLAREAEIEDMEPLRNLDIPHWVARCGGPVGDFLTRYSQQGGMHHLVALPGRRSSALHKLAFWHGFGFSEV